MNSCLKLTQIDPQNLESSNVTKDSNMSHEPQRRYFLPTGIYGHEIYSPPKSKEMTTLTTTGQSLDHYLDMVRNKRISETSEVTVAKLSPPINAPCPSSLFGSGGFLCGVRSRIVKKSTLLDESKAVDEIMYTEKKSSKKYELEKKQLELEKRKLETIWKNGNDIQGLRNIDEAFMEGLASFSVQNVKVKKKKKSSENDEFKQRNRANLKERKREKTNDSKRIKYQGDALLKGKCIRDPLLAQSSSLSQSPKLVPQRYTDVFPAIAEYSLSPTKSDMSPNGVKSNEVCQPVSLIDTQVKSLSPRTFEKLEVNDINREIVLLRNMGQLRLYYFGDLECLAGRGGVIEIFLLTAFVDHSYIEIPFNKMWLKFKEGCFGDIINSSLTKYFTENPALPEHPGNLVSLFNAEGTLPCLFHEGCVLSETNAILRYLAKRLGQYGRNPLVDYMGDMLLDKLSYWRDASVCLWSKYIWLKRSLEVKNEKNQNYLLKRTSEISESEIQDQRESIKQLLKIYIQSRQKYFSTVERIISDFVRFHSSNADFASFIPTFCFCGKEPSWIDFVVFAVIWDDFVLCRAAKNESLFKNLLNFGADVANDLSKGKECHRLSDDLLNQYPHTKSVFLSVVKYCPIIWNWIEDKMREANDKHVQLFTPLLGQRVKRHPKTVTKRFRLESFVDEHTNQISYSHFNFENRRWVRPLSNAAARGKPTKGPSHSVGSQDISETSAAATVWRNSINGRHEIGHSVVEKDVPRSIRRDDHLSPIVKRNNDLSSDSISRAGNENYRFSNEKNYNSSIRQNGVPASMEKNDYLLRKNHDNSTGTNKNGHYSLDLTGTNKNGHYSLDLTGKDENNQTNGESSILFRIQSEDSIINIGRVHNSHKKHEKARASSRPKHDQTRGPIREDDGSASGIIEDNLPARIRKNDTLPVTVEKHNSSPVLVDKVDHLDFKNTGGNNKSIEEKSTFCLPMKTGDSILNVSRVQNSPNKHKKARASINLKNKKTRAPIKQDDGSASGNSDDNFSARIQGKHSFPVFGGKQDSNSPVSVSKVDNLDSNNRDKHFLVQQIKSMAKNAGKIHRAAPTNSIKNVDSFYSKKRVDEFSNPINNDVSPESNDMKTANQRIMKDNIPAAEKGVDKIFDGEVRDVANSDQMKPNVGVGNDCLDDLQLLLSLDIDTEMFVPGSC